MISENGLYQLAINTWGSNAQNIMVLEETAELQKEVCKLIRGDHSADRIDKIAEEIADVRIMCNQLEYGLEIKVQVARQTKIKLARLRKLLGVVEDKTIDDNMKLINAGINENKNKALD